MTLQPQRLHRATGTALFVLVASSFLLPSCGSGSSPTATPTPTPTPTPTITTETFAGTIQPTGVDVHPFTVVAQGPITATLTSLSPQSTITMGFGLGQPSGTACALISGAYTESAKAGYAISGTIAVGSYCVELYDLGNMTSANDYVITVAHP
jgi:hypothetical protein